MTYLTTDISYSPTFYMNNLMLRIYSRVILPFIKLDGSSGISLAICVQIQLFSIRKNIVFLSTNGNLRFIIPFFSIKSMNSHGLSFSFFLISVDSFTAIIIPDFSCFHCSLLLQVSYCLFLIFPCKFLEHVNFSNYYSSSKMRFYCNFNLVLNFITSKFYSDPYSAPGRLHFCLRIYKFLTLVCTQGYTQTFFHKEAKIRTL